MELRQVFRHRFDLINLQVEVASLALALQQQVAQWLLAVCLEDHRLAVVCLEDHLQHKGHLLPVLVSQLRISLRSLLHLVCLDPACLERHPIQAAALGSTRLAPQLARIRQFLPLVSAAINPVLSQHDL